MKPLFYKKIYIPLHQWFSTFFEKEELATHQEYPSYNQTTVLWKQVLNYMYQMLIVKDWNYMATHQKKLATHLCGATPWLRTTALHKLLGHIYKSSKSQNKLSNIQSNHGQWPPPNSDHMPTVTTILASQFMSL